MLILQTHPVPYFWYNTCLFVQDWQLASCIEKRIPEAFSLLGFIGNFDNGLRIGKMCKADNMKGYVIGGVSDNSSLVRVQDIAENKPNE